jgi:dihydrofolate reductase
VRKIIAAEFISIDGVIENAQALTGTYFSPELGAYLGTGMETTDTLLLGRTTYEEMAPHWGPKADDDDPIATHMSKPKLVASTTLESGNGWGPTTIIGGDLVAELTALKEQPGKNILCIGSGQLVRSLLPTGVVDELQLIVFPVIVGAGKRLFTEGEQLPLQLIESRPLGAGATYLSYAPDVTPTATA